MQSHKNWKVPKTESNDAPMIRLTNNNTISF